MDRDVLGCIQEARFEQTRSAKRKYYGGCTTSLPKLKGSACQDPTKKSYNKEKQPIQIFLNVAGQTCTTGGVQDMEEPGWAKRLAVRSAMGKQPGLETLQKGGEQLEHPEANNEFESGGATQYQTSPSSGVNPGQGYGGGPGGGLSSMSSLSSSSSIPEGAVLIGSDSYGDQYRLKDGSTMNIPKKNQAPRIPLPTDLLKPVPYQNPRNDPLQPPTGTLIVPTEPDPNDTTPSVFYPVDFNWFWVSLSQALENVGNAPRSTRSYTLADLGIDYAANRWTLEKDEVYGFIEKAITFQGQQEDPTNQHDVYDAMTALSADINESVTTTADNRYYLKQVKKLANGDLLEPVYHPTYNGTHVEPGFEIFKTLKDMYDKHTESEYGRIVQFSNLEELKQQFYKALMTPFWNLMNTIGGAYDVCEKLSIKDPKCKEWETKINDSVKVCNSTWKTLDEAVIKGEFNGSIAHASGRQAPNLKINTTFRMVPNCVFWKLGKNTDDKCPGQWAEEKQGASQEEKDLVKNAADDKYQPGSAEANKAALLITDKNAKEKFGLTQDQMDKIKALADIHTKEQMKVKEAIDTNEIATLDKPTIDNKTGLTPAQQEIAKETGQITSNNGGGFTKPAAVPTLIPTIENPQPTIGGGTTLKPPPIDTGEALLTPTTSESAIPPSPPPPPDQSSPAEPTYPYPQIETKVTLAKDGIQVVKDALGEDGTTNKKTAKKAADEVEKLLDEVDAALNAPQTSPYESSPMDIVSKSTSQGQIATTSPSAAKDAHVVATLAAKEGDIDTTLDALDQLDIPNEQVPVSPGLFSKGYSPKTVTPTAPIAPPTPSLPEDSMGNYMATLLAKNEAKKKILEDLKKQQTSTEDKAIVQEEIAKVDEAIKATEETMDDFMKEAKPKAKAKKAEPNYDFRSSRKKAPPSRYTPKKMGGSNTQRNSEAKVLPKKKSNKKKPKLT